MRVCQTKASLAQNQQSLAVALHGEANSICTSICVTFWGAYLCILLTSYSIRFYLFMFMQCIIKKKIMWRWQSHLVFERLRIEKSICLADPHQITVGRNVVLVVLSCNGSNRKRWCLNQMSCDFIPLNI